MSAVLDNVVLSDLPVDTTVVEVPKTKKPVLPAKLGKFLVFGYAFVCDLQASGALAEDLVERAYDHLRVFASVEEQTLYYQNFLDQSTATAKVLRKFVALRSKPPKPLKNKKNTAADGADGAATPRASKPRAKKSVRVVSDAANDLIGQIVAAANSDLPLDTTVTEGTGTEVKPKKPRAPRKPKTVVAVAAAVAETATPEEPVVSNEVVTEPVVDAATEVKAKKPRAPRKPKTTTVAAETVASDTEPVAVADEAKPKKSRAPRKSKTDTAPATEIPAVETVVEPLAVEPPSVRPSTPILPEEEDDDDGSINATEFIYNGVQYLIDDEFNVYSNDTQEIVGLYDPVSKILTSNDA
jgi:hypothetical protein